MDIERSKLPRVTQDDVAEVWGEGIPDPAAAWRAFAADNPELAREVMAIAHMQSGEDVEAGAQNIELISFAYRALMVAADRDKTAQQTASANPRRVATLLKRLFSPDTARAA